MNGISVVSLTATNPDLLNFFDAFSRSSKKIEERCMQNCIFEFSIRGFCVCSTFTVEVTVCGLQEGHRFLDMVQEILPSYGVMKWNPDSKHGL